MIAEEIISAAVKGIASRAGYHVDRARAGDSRRKIEIHPGELELLHHLLRQVDLVLAFDRVAHVAAVHGNGGFVRFRAQHRHCEQRVVLRGRPRADGYAWLQGRQLQEAAAVQRDALDLLPSDHAVDGVTLVFNLACGHLDLHHFTHLAHQHADVSRSGAPGLDRRFAHDRAKPFDFDPHLIEAGGQPGHAIRAALGGTQRTLRTGRLVLDHNGGARNRRITFVRHGARNNPYGCLRENDAGTRSPQKTFSQYSPHGSSLARTGSFPLDAGVM